MTKSLFLLCLLATPSLFAQNGGYADLVEDIQGAIVSIESTKEESERPSRRDPFDFFRRQQQENEASGTGFIISEDGYIVTNRHVVKDFDDFKVTLSNEREYEAKLIGTDDSMDVALLKIDGKGLTSLKIGDSEKMRIGDRVLALGYPLSLGFSVTSGIISGIGRDFRNSDFDVASYIQTDADITFGNSGGPLVNTKGEVIAINTMIVTRGETYGFSIPSHLFMNSITQLRETGEVRRGALGVSIRPLDEEMRDYYGVDNGAMVATITKGMPAEKADINVDDIILKINGKNVNSPNDVITTISSKSPGDKVELLVLSEGKKRKVKVELGDRSYLFEDGPRRTRRDAKEDQKDIEPENSGLGFTLMPIPADMFARDMPTEIEGLMIDEVKGEMATRKGLRRGLIVTRINDKHVKAISDIQKAMKGVKDNKVVPVRILSFGDDFSDRIERTIFLRKVD